MTNYPRFSTGLNKLDADTLNRLVRMLQWYEGQSRKLEIKRPRTPDPLPGGVTFGRITGQASIGPNRWSYGWVRVSYDSVAEEWIDGDSGGVSGGTNQALNLAELRNTAELGAWGQGLSNDEGTLEVNPIPVNHVVRLSPQGDGDDRVWWFSAYDPLNVVCNP